MTSTVYEWDCYVLSIGRKYFWARMKKHNMKVLVEHDMDVRIPIDKVTKRDHNVFSAGTLFTMSMYRNRVSLKFSHLRYTKAEIEQAEHEATMLTDKFRSAPSRK